MQDSTNFRLKPDYSGLHDWLASDLALDINREERGFKSLTCHSPSPDVASIYKIPTDDNFFLKVNNNCEGDLDQDYRIQELKP